MVVAPVGITLLNVIVLVPTDWTVVLAGTAVPFATWPVTNAEGDGTLPLVMVTVVVPFPVTARVASHEEFGAVIPSSGVSLLAASSVVSSFNRLNSKLLLITFVISLSKLTPVVRSVFFVNALFESQIQLRKP